MLKRRQQFCLVRPAVERRIPPLRKPFWVSRYANASHWYVFHEPRPGRTIFLHPADLVVVPHPANHPNVEQIIAGDARGVWQ